ncbi:MAG: hypothetical protein QGI41_07915 [Acidimicrobiales bacterium]|jgi:hypothetical protein|nr:hypothetical protein [Acidimicrobiales bacterium]|tara:strand:+ start:865 stop:2307 length:1443 start_codon:yes stop_codon:yes gene_type:complete
MVAVGMVATITAAVGIPARTTYGAQVSVDEPQYLMTAISLGEDFDLDVSDEIDEERYLPFHQIGLNTQTIDLNDQGQRISPHDPLLPAMLALPMRVGGWVAARASIAALAGLLAAATLWVAVRRFGVSTRTGAWVVGVLSATPPLTAYGSQIYPELPAALAMVVAVGAVSGLQVEAAETRSRTQLLMALVVAATALPWLSVKYVPTTAAVVGIAARNLWRLGQRRLLLIGGLALSAMGILYVVFHVQVYGGWTVYSAGDHFVTSEFGVVGFDPDYWGRSRRLVGLLIDRPFGLASWSPAWLAMAPALGALLARRSAGWSLLALPIATGWATATWLALTMHGWWWPGRQVVVILPLVVVVIAIAVDRARRMLLPLVASATVGAAGWIWVAIEASTGRRALAVDVTETSWVGYRWFSRLFPDLQRSSASDLLWAFVWTLVLLAWAVLAGRRASVEGDEDASRSEGANADKVASDLDGGSAIW